MTDESAKAAASALFLGQNGEWWDFWLIVSVVFAALAAIAIGITTTGSIVSHKGEAAAAEEALERYKLETGDKISDSNARAAEANARALEAQVALEKFKAPRAISVEQRNRIAEEMKQFAGQEYFGLVASGVADAWDVWREVSLSLELAGWKRIPPPGPQASQYGPPAGIAAAPQAGVMIWASAGQSSPQQTMATYERAKALAAKLTDESVIAGAGFAGDIQQPAALAVVIGPKP